MGLSHHDLAVILTQGPAPDREYHPPVALLRLGYGIGPAAGRSMELVVVNLEIDPQFFDKLAKLAQHFGLSGIQAYPVGGQETEDGLSAVDTMRAYNKEGRATRQIIAGLGDAVFFEECGLREEELEVLDLTLAQLLATFIRRARGEIERRYNRDVTSQIFTAGAHTLTVHLAEGFEGPIGNYLLLLYQALTEYPDTDDNIETFEEGVERIAHPMRTNLVRRLQLEAFWRKDRMLPE